ncbi:H-NS histone family protein [uncultured Massilia sp.]|uniref:H-NS histone family protein n=1 Tax=uncultured Massilia sp. TaxID=169973 RepID=UPI0025CDB87A|nr:H-NS histone family protein [uncultured Massilia sp.]
MAAIDLSDYTLGELKGLLFDVQKELKERQRGELRQARERIAAIARDVGVPVGDLLAKEAAKGAPRYRNPDDASQTWNGRGRHPQWLSDALDGGKSLDEFRLDGADS